MTPRKQHSPEQTWCTYELTVTVAAHTRTASVQDRWSPSRETRKGPGSHPNQEVICNWYLLAKGNSVSFSLYFFFFFFFQRSLTEYSAFQGNHMPIRSTWPMQKGLTPWIFCLFGLRGGVGMDLLFCFGKKLSLLCLFWWSFCILVFWELRKKRHKNKVGVQWGRRFWEHLREEETW